MKVSSFTIVTPCRNAEKLVRVTAESVLGQTAVRSGRVTLQYVVCDGASTDGTLDVVREVCGDRAELISQPDRGMYQALANGLRRATGDVVAYLNAGDFYHPRAFDIVSDVIETGRARWVTGIYYVCNARGELIRSLLPHRFRRSFIRRGVYGRLIPLFIQQESTFWLRSLMDGLDYDQLENLKLAGDFYLWKCFAAKAELAIVDTFIGAFVRHAGQQSEDQRPYRREMVGICDPIRPWDVPIAIADAAGWALLPPPLKKLLNRELLFRWSDLEGCWK